MEKPTATRTASVRNFFERCWPWLVIWGVILFSDIIRLRLLAIPLTRDEGEYAYAGQLILQGIPPYELAYSMKLPGTDLAYALGMAAFGQTTPGIHLTLLVMNNMTVGLLFLLGRKLLGNLAAVVTGVSYAIMTLSPTVSGLASEASHFVVLFAVSGILLLLKATESGGRKILFTSGFLFGLAFLMKQQGICFGLFGFVFLVATTVKNRELFSRSFAGKLLTFGTGMCLPFALTCLWLARAGFFQRFWFWTVIYARAYEGEMPAKTGISFYLMDHLQQTRDLSFGFWALTFAGVLAAGCQRNFRRPMIFLLTLWAFSFLGTAAGFYFRGHYFILVLPAFALLLGMSVTALQTAWRFAWHADVFKSLPVMAFGLILSWMIFYQSQPFFQWSARQFRDDSFLKNPCREAITVAKWLRENSASDARVAVIGSEPEIYFYAHRRSATGYIYMYALMETQPYALEMQHDMVQEIETNRPEFLVQVPYYLSWLPKANSPQYLSDWFERYAHDHYEKVGVAGIDAAGNEFSAWDPASNFPPLLPAEHLTVFRRKTESP